jgi:phage baseplate assembly protein W
MLRRTQYRINPIDLKKNTAVGVKLPMGGSPIFKSSYTTEDQALSNLKNLLLTRKGERPFQPLFGTDVYSLLFENININVESQLSQSIKADINFWLPYILVDEVIVNSDIDNNRISITLNVRVSETGANIPVIINVSNQGSVSIV